MIAMIVCKFTAKKKKKEWLPKVIVSYKFHLSSSAPTLQMKRTKVKSTDQNKPLDAVLLSSKHSNPKEAHNWRSFETASPLFWLCHLSKTTSGLWEDGPGKRTKVPGRTERGATKKDEKQMEVKQRILQTVRLLGNVSPMSP